MANKPYTPADVLDCVHNIVDDDISDVPSEVSVIYCVCRWGVDCYSEALGRLFQFIDSADSLGVFGKL